ncbi:AI-2E family transporter [Anaeromicropila populeti]|uniref:Predicted PurR-regulated permease PerM n=1 Tax=Anaeromicropila populeti TaxID=37658 RepID=A0A1I6LBD4_9FIRM|nr:AI-2E family transporter [Anaeromicropila populeti]SFS00739.1 Predicted PurR-regulated permease PerM [Anaeromicropila populeti]
MAANSSDSNKNSDKRNVFESNKQYFTICIYALFVITVGSIIIYSIMNWSETRQNIENVFGILSPFIAAFFIAFLLTPLTKNIDQLLEKYLMKSPSYTSFRKGISIFCSYIVFLGIIILTFIYVIPQLGTSIQDLTQKLTDNPEQFSNMFNGIYDYLNTLETRYPDLDIPAIKEQINELIPQALSFGTNFVTNLFPVLVTVSVSIMKWIINIFLSIVISCYLLSDKKFLLYHIKRLVYALLTKEKAEYLFSTAKECNSIFSGFIIGKFIDSLIIGAICFVLMLIFQLPYALLLSVIVGITNMIPYFGPFIGAVPGVIIFLLLNPIQAVIFIIMIFALQQFDGLYLGPKILGESTGLKPLWVIFAITIGGAYFGVIGMFLGVPVVAVLGYLLNQFIQRKLDRKNIKNI